MASFKPASGQKEIKQAKKLEDVTNYGIWLLGRRDHTTNELRLKLQRKTENAEWIEQSLEQLRGWKYLDERRYIENSLKYYNEIKQFGPVRIRQEFKLKGADKDLVKLLIEESEFDYFESALQLLNKKCREPVEDRKERDKLTRFMISRGFSFDMIRYAFEEHLKDTEE